MNGILEYQNNVAPVEIGRSPRSGDTVWRGNVVMQDNTAAEAVSNNTVKGNLSVLRNNAAVISSTDSVGNNMLVQNSMVSSQVFKDAVRIRSSGAAARRLRAAPTKLGSYRRSARAFERNGGRSGHSRESLIITGGRGHAAAQTFDPTGRTLGDCATARSQ